MATNRFRHALAVCLIASVAVPAAACSTSSPSASGPTSTLPTRTAASTSATAPSSTTTSQSPSASRDVRTIAVEVYLAMWADMVEAAKTSDYTSPRLADHAAAQALLLLSGAPRRAHDSQLVAKGTPKFSPTVIGVTTPEHPVAVSLQDCMDDSGWLNYHLDGRLQNNVPGGRHRATATVGLLNGRWVVTRLETGEVGTCS